MTTTKRAIEYWSTKVNSFTASVYESGAGHPPEIARLTHELERRTVLESLEFTGKETVVDIGAGAGRWSLTLAPLARRVVALEPSDIFPVLQQNASHQINIECIRQSHEQYSASTIADVVLVSGVLMYLGQADAERLLGRAMQWLKPGGTLILREPVSARGWLRLGQDYFSIDQTVVPSQATYWEYLRKKSFYIRAAENLRLTCTRDCVTHAPLLYYLPKWVPFRRRISQKSLQFAAREANWSTVWAYNRIARKPYEWLENLFSRRSFRFFFFKKTRNTL